jgi:hypothetical protein
MSALFGHCHCGAIQASLEPGRPVAELPFRACQCSFCRRHGAQTTSHPDSRLALVAAPGSVRRYRFGRRSVDAILCAECGVYVASLLSDAGALLATVNVAGLALPGFGGREPESAVYEDESDAERLARRRARWTPATLVEASPSA